MTKVRKNDQKVEITRETVQIYVIIMVFMP